MLSFSFVAKKTTLYEQTGLAQLIADPMELVKGLLAVKKHDLSDNSLLLLLHSNKGWLRLRSHWSCFAPDGYSVEFVGVVVDFVVVIDTDDLLCMLLVVDIAAEADDLIVAGAEFFAGIDRMKEEEEEVAAISDCIASCCYSSR